MALDFDMFDDIEEEDDDDEYTWDDAIVKWDFANKIAIKYFDRIDNVDRRIIARNIWASCKRDKDINVGTLVATITEIWLQSALMVASEASLPEQMEQMEEDEEGESWE